MGTNAIELENVWKKYRLYHEKNQYLKAALLRGHRSRYDDFWALKGIDLQVAHGSTFGIIGSNGSGKSTLLKCLAGILQQDSGKLRVEGRVAALLELGAGFHPELSGRENIFLNGAILGMSQRDIAKKLENIVSFAGLGQFLDSPVKNYSSGMVVRLGFAIAINVDPEILLIDEVLAVGDESFQQRCYERIEEFRRDGRTIVFVSHGLTQVTQLCETVAWIDKGEVRELGPAYSVVNSYTGISHEAKERVAGEQGDRWGTGEVEITRVVVTGLSGSSLETHQPATFKIHYQAHVPTENAVVGIRVTHMHGMNIWGTNTKRRGFKVPLLHGTGCIELLVESLPLLEGTFDLTVAISDVSEVKAYDHWEKRVRFDVRQVDTFDEGLVSLESTWSIAES